MHRYRTVYAAWQSAAFPHLVTATLGWLDQHLKL
jgi:hypothetical protein